MATKDEEYFDTTRFTHVHFVCRAQAGGNVHGGLKQGGSQGDELH